MGAVIFARACGLCRRSPRQPNPSARSGPQRSLATLVNVVSRLVQIVPSRGTMASEIRDATKAYSIAVTPS